MVKVTLPSEVQRNEGREKYGIIDIILYNELRNYNINIIVGKIIIRRNICGNNGGDFPKLIKEMKP